jgi:hypothetical protein
MTVLLTRRATLQAAVETTYNTPVAVDNTDGILVSTPDFSITPNVLERDFTRPDISPLPFIIGRKIAKMEFETELRGNDAEQSGLLANAPVIARLFQACGYSLSGHTGSFAIGPYQTNDQVTQVAWSISSEVAASDVLTATAAPADGDTIVVGGKTYTWHTVLTNVDGNVLIGGSEANALANMGNAINLGNGAGTNYALAMTANPEVTSTAHTGTTLTVTAINGGSAGNSIAATKTGSSVSWATADLSGGADAGTNTDVIAYYLNVTTPGASGTAQVTITSDTAGEGSAAILTSGTPVNVGTKGLTITPVFSGNLVDGQSWVIWLMPPGLTLQPVSDNFTSVTLVMNKDGVLHQMPGALGTFDVTAEAGNYARIKWTFTGTYVEPTDNPLPNPSYETTLPSQVQLARLMIGSFPAIVAKMTYNQGNDIQIRPDVSASDGYLGVRLVSRKPEGGVDPEADNVANYDFWGIMSAANRMAFQMRVGSNPGNTVWLIGTNVQYSGLTYQDRNGISTYQAGLRFARQVGDDEVFFHFM